MSYAFNTEILEVLVMGDFSAVIAIHFRHTIWKKLYRISN